MEKTQTIDLKKIREIEIGSSKLVKIKFLPELAGGDFHLISAIEGTICITRLDKSFQVKFDLNTRISQQCCRCLKEFSLPIEIKTKQIYDETDNEVDIWPTIREEIIVLLPMKPLCKEKCSGIKY